MSHHYQELIHQIDPTVNPAGVEAMMLASLGPLDELGDELDDEVFTDEIEIAKIIESRQPGYLAGVAASQTMIEDYERWHQATLEQKAHSPTRKRLNTTLRTFKDNSRTLVGFPVNQDFDYSDLHPFLQYPANNIGDPFQNTIMRLNTHDTEREVIMTFADLMHLQRDQAWGYVTSGGTEGNMYGLFMGRELYPDGTVYFSQDTHYSIVKLLRLLNMKSVMIRSQPNGQMDYEDLRQSLRVNPQAPAIIVANIGTTMKGAIDDLRDIRAILKELDIQHSYIHADAALSGMILPFVDHPQPHGFDAGIDSIAVSGHKLIGSPVPCGIVLTRRDYVARIARSIEYVGIMDTTIPGSRSALSPLIIWHALQRQGTDGFRKIVAGMMDTAGYAVNRFNQSGIPAWRNPNSATVVFPRPGP